MAWVRRVRHFGLGSPSLRIGAWICVWSLGPDGPGHWPPIPLGQRQTSSPWNAFKKKNVVLSVRFKSEGLNIIHFCFPMYTVCRGRGGLV